MYRSRRRVMLGGFVAAMGGLVAVSVAYACTLWQGQMTICGNATPSQCVQATGDGFMTSVQSGSTSAYTSNANFNVAATALVADTGYNINFLPPPYRQHGDGTPPILSPQSSDCMDTAKTTPNAVTPNNAVNMGHVSTDATGSFSSQNFAVPATQSGYNWLPLSTGTGTVCAAQDVPSAMVNTFDYPATGNGASVTIISGP